MNDKSVSIRPARREDVAAIVAMLADDHLGRARERVEDPLPASYYQAFERVERDQNLTLVVAESEGRVVGCLQLAVLAGHQLARRHSRPARRCPRCFRLSQPRHRRAIGAMGDRGSESARLQSGRTADASDANRRAALLQASRIFTESRRHDCPLLTQLVARLARSANRIAHSFILRADKLPAVVHVDPGTNGATAASDTGLGRFGDFDDKLFHDQGRQRLRCAGQ